MCMQAHAHWGTCICWRYSGELACPTRCAQVLAASLSLQTSVSERRDTVTELPPLAGGSGNSAGSGRRVSRPQPSPRGGTLQGRSDLFARLPAVLRTRSGGPLEVQFGAHAPALLRVKYAHAPGMLLAPCMPSADWCLAMVRGRVCCKRPQGVLLS